MENKKLFQTVMAAAVLFTVSFCLWQPLAAAASEASGPARAVSVLHPTEGNGVNGKVVFTGTGEGVTVAAEVKGLAPGKHGFHIHDFGDCSAPDGTSAGGHFNPENTDHGGPEDKVRHVGDLGNLEADAQGNAYYERGDSYIALSGPHSIIGRSVIIHAGFDDLKSQPTGAAGGRVACGVIGIAE